MLGHTQKLITSVLLTVFLSGCAFIKPTTCLSVNPVTRTISFTDTKDNDVSVEYVGYNAETKQFEVKNVVVRNNSSDVIQQNVAQMQAFVEQQRAANEGIIAAFEGLGHLAGLLGEATSQLVKALPDVQGRISVDSIGSASVETSGRDKADTPVE